MKKGYSMHKEIITKNAVQLFAVEKKNCSRFSMLQQFRKTVFSVRRNEIFWSKQKEK